MWIYAEDMYLGPGQFRTVQCNMSWNSLQDIILWTTPLDRIRGGYRTSSLARRTPVGHHGPSPMNLRCPTLCAP